MNLCGQLVEACRSDSGFVSVAALRRLVDETAVNQYLDSINLKPSTFPAPLSQSIVHRARKMFAILVKCRLSHYVHMLMEDTMIDERFPIDDKFNLPIQPAHLEEIQDCQWVIAPLWKTNVHLEIPKHLKISLDDLFDQQPRPRVDQGTFGIIEQIKIKEGHVENYGPDQVNPTYSLLEFSQ